jgi:hypothetical protein
LIKNSPTKVGTLTPLFGGSLSAQLDLVWGARIVYYFERRLPLKGLDAASSGVVFATVNEGE